MSMDFVIEQKQRGVVEENFNRIKELFHVQISFANGTAEKVWITLKGGQVDKAKNYIQALTNPEGQNRVAIPASLIKTFGPRTNEHFKLESEYGVVIRFPQDTKAVITGSPMNVILASTKLEDLVSKHSSNTTQAKPPQPKTSQPKANRALDDFALKLGYEQEQINMVFEKLGPTVDKNTFLKELINVSGAGSKIADDRWSPVSPRVAAVSRQEQFVRHPSEMVVAKGILSSACMNSQMYGADNGVVARGIIPRSLVKVPPPNSPQGYPNQDYMPVGNGINPYIIPRTIGPSTQRSNTNGSGVIARGFMPRTTAPSAQGSSLSPSDVISRGFIPRTTSQTTQGSSSTYSSSDWSNSSYLVQGSGYALNSDPQQVDQMVDRMTSRYQQLPQSDLRHIVIDGSNVAMSHGNNKIFSCRGIALCVDWFRQRGHKQITVFVPSWRKESAKMDNPITDQHFLNQLEEQGYLTFTPSRKVKGRRIVCYDDRYLIKLAESTDGIIVSNDNFKDLASESHKWREVIEQRLLMYSFVNDMFMPPDDPLGRHGPTLNEFLHKGTQTHRRVCPYGRRCTYGTRCKYHHPEREDHRLPIYQSLKVLFPNQDALILSVMKKYPQEKDADKLASYILSMMH